MKEEIMQKMFGQTDHILKEIEILKNRKNEFKDILQLKEAQELKQ